MIMIICFHWLLFNKGEIKCDMLENDMVYLNDINSRPYNFHKLHIHYKIPIGLRES